MNHVILDEQLNPISRYQRRSSMGDQVVGGTHIKPYANKNIEILNREMNQAITACVCTLMN